MKLFYTILISFLLCFNVNAFEGFDNYTYVGYTSETIKLAWDTTDKLENDFYEIRLYSFDKKEYYDIIETNSNQIDLVLPKTGLYIVEARTCRPGQNEILYSEWVTSLTSGKVGEEQKGWWILGFIEPPTDVIIGFFKQLIFS